MDQEKPSQDNCSTNDIPHSNKDEKLAFETKVYGVDCMFNCGTCGACRRKNTAESEHDKEGEDSTTA